MSRLYGPNHRAMQMAFQTRELADRIEDIAMKPKIDDMARAFIESRDIFFLTSIDHKDRPTVSYKGGAPGFMDGQGDDRRQGGVKTSFAKILLIARIRNAKRWLLEIMKWRRRR